MNKKLFLVRSAVAALVVAGWAVCLPAMAGSEQRFPTPEAAESALVTAAKASDTNALLRIFGPESGDLVSRDAVQASNALATFVRRVNEKASWDRQSESNIVLQIGWDAWPFPIPLIQDQKQWYFDTAAGREEILNRRIGMNELAAIRVCHAYVDAQREYASAPRNGDDILEYALRLRSSSTNSHDGLYWHAAPGEEMSPFGPLIAESHEEGYHKETKIMANESAPFRGYCFKILTRQGSHAPAGKYNYLINGHLLAGFALVAWPVEWNNSGIMSFIVNQQGKVYQKNLGPKTARLAAAMTTYDPDPSWQAVTDDSSDN
jgi:hypothetical protein